MLRQGVDIVRLRREEPARAWNVVYSYVVEHVDEKERKKWDTELFRRPPGSSRKAGDEFDRNLQAMADQYLKSLPPGFGQIDSKKEKTGEE